MLVVEIVVLAGVSRHLKLASLPLLSVAMYDAHEVYGVSVTLWTYMLYGKPFGSVKTPYPAAHTTVYEETSLSPASHTPK